MPRRTRFETVNAIVDEILQFVNLTRPKVDEMLRELDAGNSGNVGLDDFLRCNFNLNVLDFLRCNFNLDFLRCNFNLKVLDANISQLLPANLK